MHFSPNETMGCKLGPAGPKNKNQHLAVWRKMICQMEIFIWQISFHLENHFLPNCQTSKKSPNGNFHLANHFLPNCQTSSNSPNGNFHLAKHFSPNCQSIICYKIREDTSIFQFGLRLFCTPCLRFFKLNLGAQKAY